MVWPEKLAGEFAGKLGEANFGDRCRELGVAARETGRTSGISASRASPPRIYR